MFKNIFFGSFIFLFAFTGIVSAHGDEPIVEGEAVKQNISGLLPGDFFYFLDILSEEIGTLFTFGDVAKAERYISLADERLAEAQELARAGESKRAGKVTKKYQKRLEKALKKAKKAKDEGKDVDEVLSTIAEATVKHQTVLADVYDKVPQEAKGAIEEAMKNSIKGYEVALSAISKDMQGQMQTEIEQLLGDIDAELTGLREEGKKFPKVKIKHLDEIDEFFNFDDLDDLSELDELDDIDETDDLDYALEDVNDDAEDFGEHDLDDLEGLDKKFEKEMEKMFKDDTED